MGRKKAEDVQEAVVETQALVEAPATRKDLEELLTMQQQLAPRLTPEEIVDEAGHRAKLLVQIVEQCGLAKVLGRDRSRKFLMVEGWQTLAQFYDLTAEAGEVEAVDMHGVQGFKAKAVVRKMSTGEPIGCAEAFVMDDEANWKGRNLYAKMSMAQTRAVSKCLRLKLSWVAVLAGFQATPAEEIPEDEIDAPAPPAAPRRASSQAPAPPPPPPPDEPMTPQQVAAELGATIVAPEGEKYITDAQRRMFFAAMNEGGHKPEDGKAMLAARGIDSTKHILKKDFQDILKWAKTPAKKESDVPF